MRLSVLTVKSKSVTKVNNNPCTWTESLDKEDQDVGGWTILKLDLRDIGWDGVDWIDMA
jgi:hypothetical protein